MKIKKIMLAIKFNPPSDRNAASPAGSMVINEERLSTLKPFIESVISATFYVPAAWRFKRRKKGFCKIKTSAEDENESFNLHDSSVNFILSGK